MQTIGSFAIAGALIYIAAALFVSWRQRQG
jgi:hypothetical protein